MSLATLSLAAISAGLLVASPATAATPGSPTAVASFPVLHGVGLSWTGDYSGANPTTYSIYSRADAGSGWTQIGTENASPTDHTGSYIDGTIDNGTSAEYAVTETTSGGESPKSEVVTASRPATDPIAGSGNSITVDAGADPTLSDEHFDSSEGAAVTLTHNVLTGSQSGATASATIPMVAGPGSYPIGGAAVPFDLTTSGATCSTETGTLTVIDVAYDLNIDPVLFSASYALSCDGGPTVYGDVRWHSTQPYRSIAISPTAVSGIGTPVGTSTYVEVDVTNTGTETAHLNTVTIAGPQQADWALQPGAQCSNVTLPVNSVCQIQLTFSPSDSGHRDATLSFTDNTARGSHVVSLDGIGELAPGAPPTTARLAVHKIQISWTAPNDGGAPITAYDVYKTAPGQAQQLVDTVTPQTPDVGGSYTETNVPTGISFEYAVVAHNAAGDSPDAVVTATLPSDEILIDATTAITTAGDEPVDVATPDIRGRVAVTPGSTRIVYPAKYSDGSIDLAVASPFGTIGQMRLTTMGATDPAISMDGATVAFVHVSSSGEPSIWTVPLSGGTPTKVANDVTNPSWLPDGRSLVAEHSTDEATPATGESLVTLSLAGAMTDIPGTTNGHEPAVSPDGTHIAYQQLVAGTYALAVIPVAGGTAATSSSTTTPIEDISWRSDGAKLFAASGGKVRQATYSDGAGPGSLSTLSPPDVTGVRWPAYINSKAVSLLDPTPYTGKRVALQIATAADATTTCSLDGGASSPCNKSWNSVVNLSAGRHTLVVTSVPDDGVASSAIWSFVVDTAKPHITVHHLAKKTHRKTITVKYSGRDDNAIASYDVRFARGSSKKKLGQYQYPHSWQATTETSQTLRVGKPGFYCFSARSHDAAGNTSPWSKNRCTKAT